MLSSMNMFYLLAFDFSSKSKKTSSCSLKTIPRRRIIVGDTGLRFHSVWPAEVFDMEGPSQRPQPCEIIQFYR